MQKLTAEQVNWALEGRHWGRAEQLLYLQLLQREKPSDPISLRKLAAAFGCSHTQASRTLEYIAARGWLPLVQQAGQWVWADETAVDPEPSQTAAVAKVEKQGIAYELTEGLARVRRMKKPLTNEQAEKLIAAHGLQAVADVLQSMDNYAKLHNYISCYQTAAKWLTRKGLTNGTGNDRAGNASLTAAASRAAEYDSVTSAAASRLSAAAKEPAA